MKLLNLTMSFIIKFYSLSFFSQRQWLDILEDSKKKKLARDKQKREAALRLVEQQMAVSTPKQEESANRMLLWNCINSLWRTFLKVTSF